MPPRSLCAVGASPWGPSLPTPGALHELSECVPLFVRDSGGLLPPHREKEHKASAIGIEVAGMCLPCFPAAGGVLSRPVLIMVGGPPRRAGESPGALAVSSDDLGCPCVAGLCWGSWAETPRHVLSSGLVCPLPWPSRGAVQHRLCLETDLGLDPTLSQVIWASWAGSFLGRFLTCLSLSLLSVTCKSKGSFPKVK